MCHNYRACALGPGSRNYRICATATEACAPYSLCSTTGSHCSAKPVHRSWVAAPARCNQRQARRAVQPQHSQKQMNTTFQKLKGMVLKIVTFLSDIYYFVRHSLTNYFPCGLRNPQDKIHSSGNIVSPKNTHFKFFNFLAVPHTLYDLDFLTRD